MLLLCSTLALSVFASSEVEKYLLNSKESLIEKENLLQKGLLKSKASELKVVTKPDDTFCTAGYTTVYFLFLMPMTVSCVRCSSISMADAQIQVADCLMDAQMLPL